MYRLIDQDKNNHHYFCVKDKGHYGKKLEEEGYTVFVLNLGINLNLFKVLKIYIFRSHNRILNCWMYHGALFGTFISYFYKVKGLFWLIRHSEINLQSTKISTFFVAKFVLFFLRTLNRLFIILKSQEST